MNGKDILKGSLIVSSLSILAKVFAFFRDIIIANKFGATWLTDCYNLSITATNIIFSLIGVALASAIIPIISEKDKEYGEDGVNKFCSNIINVTVILSILIYGIVFIFSNQIVNLIAPTYEGEIYFFAIKLIRISCINLLFMGINSVFISLLQYRKQFLGANLSNVVINVIIIFFITIFKNISIETLVLVTVIANGIQLLIQIPWLLKIKYKYTISFNINSDIKKIIFLTAPLIIGTCMSELNNLIDKSLASTLPEGSVSALSYAYKVNNLTHATFSYAIVIVLSTYIAQLYSNKKIKELGLLIQNSIIYLFIVMVFFSLFFMVFSEEIVMILFGRGNFDNNAVYNTKIALSMYSIGLSFYAIRDIFNRVFVTVGKSSVVMKNTIVGVLINILLNISLIKILGIRALALSTSISVIIITLLYYTKFKDIICEINSKEIFQCFIKIITAAIVSMGIGKFAYNIWKLTFKNQLTIILGFILIGMASMLIYLLLLIVFRVSEIKEITNFIKVDRIKKLKIFKDNKVVNKFFNIES